jgi:hypothetical protein
MANTLTFNGSFIYNGTAGYIPIVINSSITVTGDHANGLLFDVPTTSAGTLLPLGSVINAGVVQLYNTDPTNYVQYGLQITGTFQPLGRLLPNHIPHVFEADNNNIYLRANTATCKVRVQVIEQ